MFYGWRIVGVSFVTLFISVGFIFYSYGVFFKALTAEFGGSRLDVSIGLAVMSVAMGVLGPFLGRAVDKWSIRNIMLVGTVWMSVGFFMAARVTALWQFYLILGTVLGAGAAMIGQLPSSTLVANWFVRRRGMALGVATMGVSMSGVIMPPLSTRIIEAIGWRNAFYVYGLVAMAVLIPLVRSLVVNRPEDRGLMPDGDDDPQHADPPLASVIREHEEADWRTADILRDRDFWAITVVIGLCFFAMGATLTHTIPHATDMGFSASSAAFVLSVCALVGVIGKVLFGWIADHIDTRIALWAAIGFQAMGTILLMRAHTYPLLLAALGVFGLGMGGVVPIWGSLVGEVFGRASFGRVMGLMSPCMLPIQAFGVPYAGYVYDHTGSYDVAFRTFLVVYVLAAITLLSLRQREVDQRIKEAVSAEEA